MRTITCAAILFDLDGVLVNSDHAVETSWRAWAEGHRLDPDQVIPHVQGRRSQDTIARLAPHLDAETESRRLTEIELSHVESSRPYAGAAELLAALAEWPHAVVTSGTHDIASARLRACALPIPAVFITADVVAQGKPHPEGYLLAAQRLGIEPARCVVIEDSPAGLQAAQTAGMTVIGVATTHEPPALAAADLTLAALSQLTLRAREGLITLGVALDAG